MNISAAAFVSDPAERAAIAADRRARRLAAEETGRAARRQTTEDEHPYGAEWVTAHRRAAARNARVDDGVVSSRHGRRCLTEAVDGECVCR